MLDSRSDFERDSLNHNRDVQWDVGREQKALTDGYTQRVLRLSASYERYRKLSDFFFPAENPQNAGG
jgi:hypothetical protein